MPKPFENLTGNGCHAHISVWDGGASIKGPEVKFLDSLKTNLCESIHQGCLL